jgi:cardiolipin synthase
MSGTTLEILSTMKDPFIIATPDTHVLHWHDTGGKLLEAEFEAIANAGESIRFEHYIYRASPVGERFRDAFTEAARRGVNVTILLDYVGSIGLPHTYFDEMVALGGRFIWFNPMRWRFWPFRDHRKILVVDDTQAFIGGCNIAPEYEGDGVTDGWRDGGIGITGPVVRYFAESFDAQVERAGGRVWHPRKRGHTGWIEAGKDVSLLLMRPGLHHGVLQKALRADLVHAKNLAITMAYFLPAGRLKRALLRTCKLASSFRLLFPGKSDVPLMQIASRALYGQFQRGGAQIHEYQPQVLHAKVIVIDDIVYVGSANLDPRSLNINFEVMLRIRSAALAEQARATFERDLQHSLPVARLSWRDPASWWLRLKQKIARLVFMRLDLSVAHFFAQRIERRGAGSR